jgi:hypothetical protein
MSRRAASDLDASELKKENKALKRQLARANREIVRLQGVQEDAAEADEEQIYEVKPRCPKCLSANLGEIKTPTGKTITSCRACKKWRSRAS